MEINDLIAEGATLKTYIETATAKLREINQQIATVAEYKDGSKTGHLVGGGYTVKVSLRDNVKWDQNKIAQVITLIPAAKECFKTEYKPDSKKLDAAIARSEDLEKAINWARTVTPGAPSVTYEKIEEEKF
jgi:hypothetical protein